MQESFSNSAGRHLQDAKILLKEQRWDNAVYLAEESNRLSNLVKIMTDSPYQDIAEKLCTLFGREFKNVAKLKV